MVVVGVTETAGYLTATIVTKRVKRKVGIITSVLITSALGMLFLF
jgi:hypothetical protein